MKKVIFVAFLIIAVGCLNIFYSLAWANVIAYYPFSGNANDVSGNGYNGTVYGASLTDDRFGNANSAYSFNGVNNYIAVPEILNTGISGITIASWVKADNLNDGAIYYKGLQGEMILRKFESTGTYDFGIKMSDSSWFFATGSQVNTGEYQYVVGTYYKGDRIELWVDGVLANSVDIPDLNLFYGMLPSAIGSYARVNGFFDGVIDEVMVYDRALSATEIQALYIEGASTSVPEPATMLLFGSGLVGLAGMRKKFKTKLQ